MNAQISNKSHEWFTPPKIIELVREVMGSIDLDPCSCEEANKTVQASRFFTKEDDGLLRDWMGPNIFVNPPGPVQGDRNTKGIVGGFWTACTAQSSRSNIFWLGFSIEQLATLQHYSPYPLDFPTIILRNRINFIEAVASKSGANSSERGCRPVSQATHSNYVTLVSMDKEMIERFYKVFGKLGRRIT